MREAVTENIKISTRNLRISYNGNDILRNSSMDFESNKITAIVGPSGSGKSTFLLTLNRLWETVPECSMDGEVFIQFTDVLHNIYQKQYDVNRLRRKVGLVFQTPNPLPMTIYENIAFPLKLAGSKDTEATQERVKECLQKVGLWDEVSDRLNSSALGLSGGQQQRLCIARALVLEPEILLLDEPTSSLDHNASVFIEQLLLRLKESCTILMVSHYRDQVQRIADSIVTIKNRLLIPCETQTSLSAPPIRS